MISPNVSANDTSAHAKNNGHEPRTWLITAAASPLAIAVSREALQNGETVIAGVTELNELVEGWEARHERYEAFKKQVAARPEWSRRWSEIGMNGKSVHECQAAVAQVVAQFGKLDILLCCDGEALVGTIEEMGESARTIALARDQFETRFHAPVNYIEAVLPAMREHRGGHIVVVSSTVNLPGTPCLSVSCAAGWALDGFCESLAYEVAPFQVKISMIQAGLEIDTLGSKVSFAPTLAPYSANDSPTMRCRRLFTHLLGQSSRTTNACAKDAAEQISSQYPDVPESTLDSVLQGTVHAVVAIAGHADPPTRHIVGSESIANVKERLKAVSEEMEDFVDASYAVDLNHIHAENEEAGD